MNQEEGRGQYRNGWKRNFRAERELVPESLEGVIPNPKGKTLDQVREVMRLKHYSLRTERCDCDWIKRYIRFSPGSGPEQYPLTEDVGNLISDTEHACSRFLAFIFESSWQPVFFPR